MTMPFHLKRIFLKKWFFTSNIIKNPQETEHRIKEREKTLNEKREREREKEKKNKEKEKLQEYLQIKGKSIF
jgi:SOS response regulatory protein OraA/RecX